MKLLLVSGAQRRVGVNNADEFGVSLLRKRVEKAPDVTVLQTNYGHTNRRRLSQKLPRDNSQQADAKE